MLERHGELVLDEQTRGLLLQVSAATIDRKLQPFRQWQGRGRSTTKPSTLSKRSIPVRTLAEWDDAQPGFVEMDLVAHCGETTERQYLNTLTATHITTGWTECLSSVTGAGWLWSLCFHCCDLDRGRPSRRLLQILQGAQSSFRPVE